MHNPLTLAVLVLGSARQSGLSGLIAGLKRKK